jgi:hypothetical protein
MHLTGIHENENMNLTAHDALRMTLSQIPQRGAFVKAQPRIAKAKIMMTANSMKKSTGPKKNPYSRDDTIKMSLQSKFDEDGKGLDA